MGSLRQILAAIGAGNVDAGRQPDISLVGWALGLIAAVILIALGSHRDRPAITQHRAQLSSRALRRRIRVAMISRPFSSPAETCKAMQVFLKGFGHRFNRGRTKCCFVGQMLTNGHEYSDLEAATL